MANSALVLSQLQDIIASRKQADDKKSYTAQLIHGDIDRLLKKVGEEAVEVVIAGKGGKRQEIIYETADLLYHLLVLLSVNEIQLDDVSEELLRRFAISGLEEKASRSR